MAMLFQDWIKTQDDSRWQLPESAVKHITAHFAIREIFSDTEMERVFWNVLDDHRARFLQLVGIQDIKFDPMVNIYREIRDKSFEQQGTTKHGNKYTDGSHDDTLTRHDTDIDKYDEGNVSVGYDATDTTTSKGYGIVKDGVDVDHGRNYSYDEGQEAGGTVTLRENEKTNGKSTTTTTDENQAANTGTVSGETTKTDNEANHSGRVRDVAKAAPMSAVNIAAVQGDGDTEVKGSNIGDLDFTYASGYNQQNTSGLDKGSEQRDVQGAQEGTSSTATHGGATTAEQDNETVAGRDVETRNDGRDKVDAAEDAGRKGNENGEKSYETTNEDIAGKRADRSKHEGERTFTRDDTAQDTGSTHGEEHTDGTEDTTMARTNKVQLTGRAMLTPQQAMEDAERYLRNFGPAIAWLNGILETCFIGVWDV